MYFFFIQWLARKYDFSTILHLSCASRRFLYAFVRCCFGIVYFHETRFDFSIQ